MDGAPICEQELYLPLLSLSLWPPSNSPPETPKQSPGRPSWSLQVYVLSVRDCLAQAFVEKESGVEGAELPSAGAPAKREGEVSMDYKRFWRELGTALGMQPGAARPLFT